MLQTALNLNYQPVRFVETESLTEAEWLDYRRSGIGGSDVAAIMGQSPFCTARDLYFDKIGIKPAILEEDNWVAKEVGHRLEDLVAEIFSRKLGLHVYPVRTMFKHPLYPFMNADVDFFIDLPDGRTGILECKTTNYNCRDKWANGSVPVNYEYQGRHYMAVMNIDVVYFACLFGNNENEFVFRRMDRDLDIEADLIAEEAFFWNEYVLKRQEPPYTEKADLVLESIRRHFGPADTEQDLVKLTASSIVMLDKYLELKEKKAAVDAEAKCLEEMMKQQYAGIVEQLGTSCKGMVRNGDFEYTVTYNPVYRTGIDKRKLEQLRELHPDIYDDYISISESRRFVVKRKEAA